MVGPTTLSFSGASTFLSFRWRIVGLGFVATMAVSDRLAAQNCDNDSVDLVPLIDATSSEFYLERFPMGLYPEDQLSPPEGHWREGIARAGLIEPLDAQGNPDPDGAVVVLSNGMSNTERFWCSVQNVQPCEPESFRVKAEALPTLSAAIELVNGAIGGKLAESWVDPENPQTWGVVLNRLTDRGLTPAQVQVIWLLHFTNERAGLAHFLADPEVEPNAHILLRHLGDIVRVAKSKFPNLQIALVSSRIYGGYGTEVSHEPYTYETGFSAKWLIQAQINQMNGGGEDPIAGDLDYSNDTAPWIAWGPYPWADGLSGRAHDELIYECDDFLFDGVHPAFGPGGAVDKVSGLLVEHFTASEFTRPWFLSCVSDLDGDAAVATPDLLIMLGAWGENLGHPADLDGDGFVGTTDLLDLLGNWGPCP